MGILKRIGKIFKKPKSLPFGGILHKEKLIKKIPGAILGGMPGASVPPGDMPAQKPGKLEKFLGGRKPPVNTGYTREKTMTETPVPKVYDPGYAPLTGAQTGMIEGRASEIEEAAEAKASEGGAKEIHSHFVTKEGGESGILYIPYSGLSINLTQADYNKIMAYSQNDADISNLPQDQQDAIWSLREQYIYNQFVKKGQKAGITAAAGQRFAPDLETEIGELIPDMPIQKRRIWASTLREAGWETLQEAPVWVAAAITMTKAKDVKSVTATAIIATGANFFTNIFQAYESNQKEEVNVAEKNFRGVKTGVPMVLQTVKMGGSVSNAKARMKAAEAKYFKIRGDLKEKEGSGLIADISDYDGYMGYMDGWYVYYYLPSMEQLTMIEQGRLAPENLEIIDYPDYDAGASSGGGFWDALGF